MKSLITAKRILDHAEISSHRADQIIRWFKKGSILNEYPRLDLKRLAKNLSAQAIMHKRFARVVRNHSIIRRFSKLQKKSVVINSEVVGLWSKIKGSRKIFQDLNFHPHTLDSFRLLSEKETRFRKRRGEKLSSKGSQKARISSQKAGLIYSVFGILKTDLERLDSSNHQFGKKSRHVDLDKAMGELVDILLSGQNQRSMKVAIPDAAKLCLWCNPGRRPKKKSEKTLERVFYKYWSPSNQKCQPSENLIPG